MFGRSKNAELQQLADESKRMLLRYSNMVRSITEEFGPSELPKTGVIDPETAEVVLRRILAADGNKSKVKAESGSESRPLPANVSRIELSGPLSATVTRGATSKLQISCSDKSYLPKVITEVHGDTIRIGLKPMSFVSRSGNVTIQSINAPVMGLVAGGSVMINGSNNMVIGRNGAITGPELDFRIEIILPNVTHLEVDGSGDIDFHDVETDELDVAISGSGDICLKGAVGTLHASVAGSGDVTATELLAKKAKLQVTGSGDIEISVVESVDARVTGSGDITIHGNPATRNTRVTGSGDIDFV